MWTGSLSRDSAGDAAMAEKQIRLLCFGEPLGTATLEVKRRADAFALQQWAIEISFQPMYRLGHPEDCSFLLQRIIHSRSTCPEHV